MPDEAVITEAAPPTEDVTTTETPPPDLGDPGKKALTAERQARREAEKQLRDFQSRLAAMEEAQTKTAEERAQLLEKQRELEQAALAAEFRAAATGKLADPTDVLNFIDLSGFEVGDDGTVDGDAISAAIADLVSKKPHLGARREDPGPGSADGGARDVSRPRQWTRDDVTKARKDGRFAEIEQARHDGLLRNVLSGTDTP